MREINVYIQPAEPTGNPLAIRWARRLVQDHAEAAHDTARRLLDGGHEDEARQWLHTATYLNTAFVVGTDDRLAVFDERKAVAIINAAMRASQARWLASNDQDEPDDGT